MTVLYGAQQTLVNAGTTLDPGFANGTVRCFVETITLASQTTSDTIVIGTLPKGAIPLYGVMNNSASLGSSTVAIGITGTTDKYRAAAVKTSTTPEVFGVTAAMSVALTDAETVFITIAAASLPASGTLTVQMYYAFN